MIVFRCDGDGRTGAGHVGRCLPIAEAFLRVGREVAFVGDYDGVARNRIDSVGLPVLELALTEPAGIPARATAGVVDVYGLDPSELGEAAAKRPLIAFQDSERVALVGATPLDYHPDAGGRGLLGPDYAPVSPRFVAARRPKRSGPVVVSLGASSLGRPLLSGLLAELLPLWDDIMVVGGADVELPTGAHAVNLAEGLADAFSRASAVVCGAGVTAYEAACAGVPALLIVLAENQERVAREFAALTPVMYPSRDVVGDMVPLLQSSTLPVTGPALVDGFGASRVRDALIAIMSQTRIPKPIRYRPATAEDAERLLEWRNSREVRAVSRTKDPIERSSHSQWLDSVLSDPERCLLIAETAAAPVGAVRFDGLADVAEVSVTVAPDARGRGLGTRVIRESTELQLAARPELRAVRAQIRGDNERSVRAFAAAGYQPVGEADGHLVLQAVR